MYDSCSISNSTGMTDSVWMQEEADESGACETEDAAEQEEKFVYTCNVQMETREYDESLEFLTNIASQYNGCIEQQNNTNISLYGGGSQRRSAYFVFRIPSDQLDAFFNQLPSAGNITSNSRNAENITKSCYRLEVENQLRQIQNQLAGMDNDAACMDCSRHSGSPLLCAVPQKKARA